MTQAVRLATSEDLLRVLPDGYVTLGSLIRGGRPTEVDEPAVAEKRPAVQAPETIAETAAVDDTVPAESETAANGEPSAAPDEAVDEATSTAEGRLERGVPVEDGEAAVGDEATAADQSAVAEEPLEVILARLVDSQLRSGEVGPAGVATARIQLASRTFVPLESRGVADVLEAVREVFKSRRTASCELDVILFMQNLFEQAKEDGDARKATDEFLESLVAGISDFDTITSRVWLLDGQADDGSSLTIDDVAAVVAQFDPSRLPDSLITEPTASCLFSFGARSLWFPRTQVLDYLGTRFALRVLEHEKWLDGARLPYVTVAQECADFIEVDLRPVVDRMDVDHKTSQRIIPDVRCPNLNADRPVSASIDDINKVVDELNRDEFGGIQTRLVANRKQAVVELKDALIARVERYMDGQEDRVVMSQAFLELLRSSSSPLVEGDQIDTGRPRTLRQAFEEAFEFFDKAAEFDSSNRVQAADLQQNLDEQRRNIDVMQSEVRMVRRRLSEGEDGAAAELQALQAQIEAAEAEKVVTGEQLDAAKGTVKNQDWEIIRRRDALEKHLEESIEELTVAARAEVQKSAAEVDETRDDLHKAQQELRDALVAMALRVVGLLFGLLLVGLLGVLLLPFLLVATPLAAPFLGFIGTAFGALFFKYWAVGSMAALVGYGIAQARKYLRLKRAVDEFTRRLEVKKAALLSRLRQYWDVYSRKFTARCEWVRFSHVFDTDRELEGFVDDLRARLDTFVDDLRSAKEVARDLAQGFALKGTHTELIVVDRAYAEDLIKKESERLEQYAADFFKEEDRKMSRYFSRGVATMSIDMHADCAEKIFTVVRRTNVVQAMVASQRVDLSRTAAEVPVFLPLKRGTKTPSLLVVEGPDHDGQLLRECVQGISPAPDIVATDDDEHVLLLRVAYDIDQRNITVLGNR